MTVYATQADMVSRRGEGVVFPLADRNGDDELDQDAVDLALESASSTIDAYIGQRYSLPLATVPKVLIGLCVDIAIYTMAPSGPEDEGDEKRHKAAIAFLKDISAGRANLPIAQPVAGDDVVVMESQSGQLNGMRSVW
ncbi:MAG: DUF1320 domain-containing protein [Magnetococcales bacterium]|nr:DUF1320 domain-containing protein [Magnetococcales bacterium]